LECAASLSNSLTVFPADFLARFLCMRDVAFCTAGIHLDERWLYRLVPFDAGSGVITT